MKHRRLAFLGSSLAVLTLLVVASCRPLFTPKVSGKILALNGTAEGTFEGRTIPLTESTGTPGGMKIKVSPQSRLDLLLLPGIRVELEAETEIEIERLRLARDGDESIRPMIAREASIRLLRGVIFVSVGRAPTRSELKIKTDAGIVAAGSGRAFMIAAHEQVLRIVCVGGKVAFAPADGSASTKIEPGFFVVWPGAASAPERAAESGPEVQKEVANTMSAEMRLLRLERKHQHSFRQ